MAVRPRAVAASILIAAAVPLAGCSSPGYDAVLARQVLAHKDAFGDGLGTSRGVSPEQFGNDVRTDSGQLPGRFWDGAADPASLDLARGGIALYDLDEQADQVAFSVLIASGPRDAGADGIADPEEPSDGPAAIYTCFRIEADFVDGALEVWRRKGSTTDEPGAYCAPELVDTLGDGARAVPVIEFDG